MSVAVSHVPAAPDRLHAEKFDVLVVGGGIVGAGVVRDAAMRGLSAALVDERDFAAGTSSRSSRLLHGGIRYLAQGRLGLVREASREKRILQTIAPHLTAPLAFVFPTRRGTPWSKWKLALGVKLYDRLCGGRNLGPSSVLDVPQTRDRAPGLALAGLTGAVRYFDALTSDSRLTFDSLRSAASHGACVANYVRFVGAEPAAAGWRCAVEEVPGGRTLQLHARTIVNASGPWSERIPGSNTHLRLTKGIHLVIPRERLPVADAVVMAEGSRILFAIPWGERTILGTTDTDYDGPLAEPPVEQADVRYVLDVADRTFPDAQLKEGDVVSSWAGLRPLVADPRGRPSDISRRHQVTMSRPGWWDVTGGKLTTYRLMGEETVDAVVRFLNRRTPPCRTAIEPLRTDAGDVGAAVVPSAYDPAVVRRAVQEEWAVHLDDVMIRRTSWRHYLPHHVEAATQAARQMADLCGWSAQRHADELAAYHALVGGAGPASPRRNGSH